MNRALLIAAVATVITALVVGVSIFFFLDKQDSTNGMKLYCQSLNYKGRTGNDDFVKKLNSADKNEYRHLSGCWVLKTTSFPNPQTGRDVKVKTTGNLSADMASKLNYANENLQVREIAMMINESSMHYCVAEKYKVQSDTAQNRSRLLYDYPAYITLNLFSYNDDDDTLSLASRSPDSEGGGEIETYTFTRDDGSTFHYMNNLKEFEPIFYSVFRKYKKEMGNQRSSLAVSAVAQCEFPVEKPKSK
jgi:hypothetical protein